MKNSFTIGRPPWSQIDIHTPCVFNLSDALTGSLLFLCCRYFKVIGEMIFQIFYLTIKSNKEILLYQDVFGGLLFAVGAYKICRASIFNWLIVSSGILVPTLDYELLFFYCLL